MAGPRRRWTVEETDTAKRAIKKLDKTAREKYEAAKTELEHRGCEAGGTRMRHPAGGDSRFCNRRFYRQWRMHLLFGEDDYIQVTFVGQHQDEQNVHTALADIVPDEIAAVGRRAIDKPKCCHDLDDAPVADDLIDRLAELL